MARQFIEIYSSVDELQLRAAEYAAVALRPTLEGRNVHVTLSGGSTPRRMHELLAEDTTGIDWGRVHLYWGDERTVGPDDPQSNYGMARETLITRVPIPPANVYRMRGEDPPEQAARDYELALRQSFGVEPPELPRFDLLLLGTGSDGHTASLFPGTAALHERERWVVANEVPQQNTTRITLTYPVINNAAIVMFLVAGRDKADAVHRIFSPGVADKPPAAFVDPRDGVAVWLLDSEAAAGLYARR
jgi:6-phosphogluconolactonase